MKPTVSWLLGVLLLAFSGDLMKAAYGTDAVLDVDGEEIRRGQSYYVLSAGWSRLRSGGLTPETGRNYSCPFKIVQPYNRRSKGTPVDFSPVDPLDIIIRVNADQNIMFADFPTPVHCPESNVWMVNFGDANTQSSPATPIFVTTGGVEGNPGPKTLSNWFKIQEYEDAYVLQYCPSASLCGSTPCQDSLLCENIGISVMNGKRRLALSRQPIKVVFERVKRCAELVATN